MSPSGNTFNRRTLFASSLATTVVGTTGMGIALADGTDAPSNGDTTIVNADLKEKKSVGTASAKAKQVAGFATMAAATWNGDDPTTVEIQGQRLDGTWGDWISVDLLTEDGVKATDAAWVGRCSAVNVRASRDGNDCTDELTAHLIATSAASSDLGGGSNAGGTSLFFTPGTTVRTGTFGPSMFTRAEWGANESWARDSRAANALRSVIIHHTAGSNSYSKAESPQVVRGIYSYHTQTLGWADVGYNVLVDKYGQIFEGRRGGLHTHRVGAHAYAFNTGSFGISVMGNYQNTAVSSEAFNSVATLAAWKLSGSFVDSVHDTATYPNVQPNYQLQRSGNVTVPRLIGHRDVNRTSCPGNSFYGQFTNLRTHVATRMSKANAEHKNAFKAAGGESALGTVTHIETTTGSYRVTRLTKGIVLTYGGSTRAYKTSFASSWKPSWGRPLTSTTATPQKFEKGTASIVDGKVVFTAGSNYKHFIDVPDTHVFATYINALADRDIVRGWPDGTFRPANDVLRDQAIAFIYRIQGPSSYTPPRVSPFRDIPTNYVFYKEIAWAYENGLANGWKVGTAREFRPYEPMLRDQMAAFMSRAGKADLSNVSYPHFKDVNSSLVFYREIMWMGQTGIARGWDDGTYRPFNRTKRGELATFLYRYMKLNGTL